MAEPRFCSRCGGYGVVANHRTGMTEKCSECDGRHMSDAEVKAALSAAHDGKAARG